MGKVLPFRMHIADKNNDSSSPGSWFVQHETVPEDKF